MEGLFSVELLNCLGRELVKIERVGRESVEFVIIGGLPVII